MPALNHPKIQTNKPDNNPNKLHNFNKKKSCFTSIIEIWDATIRDIVGTLSKSELNNNDFVSKTKSPNRMIIIPTTPESLTKIKEALENQDTWYTL